MHWTTMSLPELRAATKLEILRNMGEYLAAKYTKRQIITWLLLDDMYARSIPDKVVVTKDDKNRVVKRVEIDLDPETGVALGGTVTTWSYYKTGETEDIVTSTRNADNVETHRFTRHHFRDGRQPTVSEKIPQEVILP